MNKTVKSIFAKAERTLDRRLAQYLKAIEEIRDAKKKIQAMKDGRGKK